VPSGHRVAATQPGGIGGQAGNRLVGILHGCLKTGACYDEHTAWGHRGPAELILMVSK